jgi:hypothetical protein
VTATVVERYGALSATGVATETVFGTGVTPTVFVPMTGNGLELDPGLFSPKVMFGRRDVNTYPLRGQNKISGSLSAPLFPTQGASLVAGGVGSDATAGNGVTGTAATVPSATTLNGGVAAGAGSITLQSATGYAQNDIIQVDVNGTTTTAECRKITNLVGSVATLDTALGFDHLTAAAVKRVQSPYTHTVVPGAGLKSFTVEKNLGGYESLKFTGAKVNKLGVQMQASNQEVTASWDMMAQAAAVQTTPTAITVVNESPYVFAEGAATLFGTAASQVSSFDLSVENGLKDTYTFNSSHNVQFLTPTTLKVSAKVDLVFTSLDDTDWGYWTKMVNGTEGALSLALTHPAGAGGITFAMPRATIRTYGEAVKMEDVILTTLNFDAFLDFTTMRTFTTTIINSQYLPY